MPVIIQITINTNDFDFKKVVFDEKSYKETFYHQHKIRYDSKPQHITFFEIIGYIEEYDGSQYLILNPGNEQRIDLFKKYKKFQNEIIIIDIKI